jgi:hypothetical protein
MVITLELKPFNLRITPIVINWPISSTQNNSSKFAVFNLQFFLFFLFFSYIISTAPHFLRKTGLMRGALEQPDPVGTNARKNCVGVGQGVGGAGMEANSE